MSTVIAAPTARPILFQGAMVRAILDGRKTQTRRPVKDHQLRVRLHRTVRSDLSMFERKPLAAGPGVHKAAMNPQGAVSAILPGGEKLGLRPGEFEWVSPYGAVGDRLWVRETWQALHVSKDLETGYADDFWAADTIPKDSQNGYWSPVYQADNHHEAHRADRGFDWRPAIHMPRWASRILLQVVRVRVERLQVIQDNEADAIAEGLTVVVDRPNDVWSTTYGVDGKQTNRTAWAAYSRLWASMYPGADHTLQRPAHAYAWENNPWVWVVEFRRVTLAPGGEPGAGQAFV